MFLILVVIFVALLILNIVICEKYKVFVLKHSVLIQNINHVNSKYNFHDITKYEFKHSYDSETYYEKVSPLDYLTYELQFCHKDVKENIMKSIDNLCNYDIYMKDIEENSIFDKYDTKVKSIFKKLLRKIEKRKYNEIILKPTIKFEVVVKLTQTKINGEYVTSKTRKFDIVEIENLIDRLNDKSNNRFNDEAVWKSIVSVERARLSNKMRFAIYKRDNNRCIKCGSSINLEIDHIIPIAKGGKTTMDNLQTLCKDCNKNKSDIIEGYTIGTYNPNIRYCKKCKAPMKLIKGKYGDFYGCTNYPRCEYKERV